VKRGAKVRGGFAEVLCGKSRLAAGLDGAASACSEARRRAAAQT